MDNEKIENLLNLSLHANPQERRASPALSSGINPSGTWTLLVRYVNSLDFPPELSVQKTILLGGYAILEVSEEDITRIAENTNILYIEKPKDLYFAITEGRRASCVTSLQNTYNSLGTVNTGLSGRGCIIGIADSGIDYKNSVFLGKDGVTRILGIWDQTLDGVPPTGYHIGQYFDRSEIEAARTGTIDINTRDTSGHGTAVASIAAGNFSTGDIPLGMAPESELLIVKLGMPKENSFPRTSELMQAVDFLVKKAVEYGKPIVINLSFGNNYGSHTGTSLFETYLNVAASTGQTSIVIGSGNEGTSSIHTGGILKNGETAQIPFSVTPYETGLSIQLWKAYYDDMEISLQMPWMDTFLLTSATRETLRFESRGTKLLVYYGTPSPYEIWQELFIDFQSISDYPDAGIYRILLKGTSIVQGGYYLWMPVRASLNGSRFLYPSPFATLTLPSTASNAITVGAYDSHQNAYAAFSGRGYEELLAYRPILKPELIAPGVDILAAGTDGSYQQVSGTSFSTAFVSGAAALLMEWGIVNGNDTYLYGEKLKAYLLKGAKPLPGYEKYPNPYIGWGTLCVADSIPD